MLNSCTVVHCYTVTALTNWQGEWRMACRRMVHTKKSANLNFAARQHMQLMTDTFNRYLLHFDVVGLWQNWLKNWLQGIRTRNESVNILTRRWIDLYRTRNIFHKPFTNLDDQVPVRHKQTTPQMSLSCGCERVCAAGFYFEGSIAFRMTSIACGWAVAISIWPQFLSSGQ